MLRHSEYAFIDECFYRRKIIESSYSREATNNRLFSIWYSHAYVDSAYSKLRYISLSISNLFLDRTLVSKSKQTPPAHFEYNNYNQPTYRHSGEDPKQAVTFPMLLQNSLARVSNISKCMMVATKQLSIIMTVLRTIKTENDNHLFSDINHETRNYTADHVTTKRTGSSKFETK